jgi:hypothetical protein
MALELSSDTLEILKNYSSINSNLVVRNGKTLNTISEAKNIMASSVVEEEFPREFGIYDLSQFLGVMSLVNSPALNFHDEFVEISDGTSGRSKVRYFYSDPEHLTSPTKMPKLPEVFDCTFILNEKDLGSIKRAASTLGYDNLSITGSNDVLTLSVTDSENNTANVFSIDVPGEFTSSGFEYIIKISNLKIMPGSYNVSISNRMISQFENVSNQIQYWIAVDKDSKLGE